MSFTVRATDWVYAFCTALVGSSHAVWNALVMAKAPSNPLWRYNSNVPFFTLQKRWLVAFMAKAYTAASATLPCGISKLVLPASGAATNPLGRFSMAVAFTRTRWGLYQSCATAITPCLSRGHNEGEGMCPTLRAKDLFMACSWVGKRGGRQPQDTPNGCCRCFGLSVDA